MDAPVDAAALPLPDSGVDAAAPGEDAAPAVRTFAMGARIAWAEEEEDDEPMTEERKRQYDEIVGKYKSRGERFGTGDGAPKKVRAADGRVTLSPASHETAHSHADCHPLSAPVAVAA